MPDLALENAHQGVVAGVDEAGRGPWAGPVVAAAAVLDINNIPDGLDDSKKLTAKKREILFNIIQSSCHIGVGVVDEQDIDMLNILGATKLAMVEAVKNLPIKPDIALVDGNQPPDLNCEVHTVIKGDSKSLSIAAASIVAKVTRDRIMQQLHKEWPHYGWDRNAGYGTREHQEALTKFGPSIYHRKSFAPVKKLLNTYG